MGQPMCRAEWMLFSLSRQVAAAKSGTKDNPSGACSFRDPCNTHDLCYSDCNKTKIECDMEFWIGTTKACNACAATIAKPKQREAARKECMRLSDNYAWGVSTGEAAEAYEIRQELNCRCECPRKPLFPLTPPSKSPFVNFPDGSIGRGYF